METRRLSKSVLVPSRRVMVLFPTLEPVAISWAVWRRSAEYASACDQTVWASPARSAMITAAGSYKEVARSRGWWVVRRPLPPHPGPLPQGEGAGVRDLREFQPFPFRRTTDGNSRSPLGRGPG